MARRRKVHVRSFGPTGKSRSFSLEVEVQAQTHSAGHRFQACVTVPRKLAGATGRLTPRRSMGDRTYCSNDRAPRRALAKALKGLAGTLVKRSSAFRGS